jgi:hypothetical protein
MPLQTSISAVMIAHDNIKLVGDKERVISNMQRIKNLKLVLLLAVLAAVPFVASAPASVSAHEGEDHSHDVAQAEGEKKESEDAKEYHFTAQPGDSFAAIARKAVQIYGIDNKVNLSQAQIVFVETNLTLAAGSPLLTEGQDVHIAEADVKAWVEKAEDLTDAQESAWEAYTVGVNFDTRSVGEA